MATLFILILFIIAFVCLLLRRVKTGSATFVFTLVCFLLIGNGLVPSILLKRLQNAFVDLPQPRWENKNAIVLLSAGTVKMPATDEVSPTIIAYSRINEATRLYLDCIKERRQCTIIVSGGDARKTGRPEAAVYRDNLLGLGVHNSDIELESNSMNTYKNAEFTSALLKKGQFDQVILVTSGINLKRALHYFSNFGIKAKPALADYLAPQLAAIPLGYNFAMTDFAIHEYLGIAKFKLYNFLGWNKNVVSPGAL